MDLEKNENYNKPLIKWVGGKTQIIDLIINNFPKKINNYHELFIGGGSVLISLLENINSNKISIKGTINAYDINQTLISFYNNVKNKPNEIIEKIKKLIDIYNNIEIMNGNQKPVNYNEALQSKESYYYWIRKEFNKLNQEEKNGVIGTSYFIFLNKTCFRGLYREGKNGFNVPFGNYKNPEIINPNHLLYISNLIKNVNFTCSNFIESFKKIKKNDFVYLDPPYYPENDKSFVSYTSNGFNLDDHNKLFELCKNYKFLMSNSNVQYVKDKFKGDNFIINIIDCKRNINSKKPNSMTKEVIIKNK